MTGMSSDGAGLQARQPFTIYAVSAANGILAICPLPGAGGDYKGDLELIHDWQPGLVISMTTEAEHVTVGAATLGIDLQSMGSRWVHLPVADFGVPGPEVNEAWPGVSASARQALNGGGRVLVHCRGGCGRSGMVVLRLLIECGVAPEAALNRLRMARPCAVETEAQMAWARSR
ncbi:protein-tyrosine phosphatase family protein [Phaeobacter gallaeciensis]|uniref:protein-tyrosine phosphatase family protein n=1 Tax=Phaeobacter gallaeciensis TaxID=60890 RepID=UPI00237EF58C|nr:protein-tyrosine phosphatase family protein [Phaeobacter gallaeciensis]MDE4303869.1 protein-tyrosine phosphatase family protein [Phaeobacter gallaeciensis]MDE4308928.1 protein-tyrosine phosphatase family protein [Phaeobacter gallaeciensis]MDE4313518.1 protein-tyrosine phosphatase family protein [Phaeobacter gallaeciensis]MDE4317857.1 protein-tyrosine phosphatase family protein [Phaeobacter gallaeciensis]MDE4322320.1 protein-tyrosine phosphatase family protein [Phaeobacter gallaeciensis]